MSTGCLPKHKKGKCVFVNFFDWTSTLAETRYLQEGKTSVQKHPQNLDTHSDFCLRKGR